MVTETGTRQPRGYAVVNPHTDGTEETLLESLETIRLRNYVPNSMMTAEVTAVNHPIAAMVDVRTHLGRLRRSAWNVPDLAAS